MGVTVVADHHTQSLNMSYGSIQLIRSAMIRLSIAIVDYVIDISSPKPNSFGSVESNSPKYCLYEHFVFPLSGDKLDHAKNVRNFLARLDGGTEPAYDVLNNIRYYNSEIEQYVNELDEYVCTHLKGLIPFIDHPDDEGIFEGKCVKDIAEMLNMFVDFSDLIKTNHIEYVEKICCLRDIFVKEVNGAVNDYPTVRFG